MYPYRLLRYIILFVLIFSPVSIRAEGDDLSLAYTSELNRFRFNYSEDWVVREEPGIIYLNHQLQNALIGIVPSLTPDELGLGENASLSLVFAAITAPLVRAGSDNQPLYGEATQLTVNNRPALLSEAEGDERHGVLVLIDEGAHTFTLATLATPSEIDLGNLFFAIIDTFEYLTPLIQDGDGEIIWQVVSEVLEVGNYTDVAVGTDGLVYVASGSGEISAFDVEDGTLQTRVSWDGVIGSFALGAEETFWVTDMQANQIVQLDRDGVEQQRFGDFEVFPPGDIVLDEMGNIYAFDPIFDEDRNVGRITVWTPEGELLRTFEINDDDAFTLLVSLAFDPDDNLVALDPIAGLRTFTPDGELLDSIPLDDMGLATAFAIDADGRIVVTTDTGTIVDVTNVAEFGRLAETESFMPGEFFAPSGVAILPDGDLVVVDTNFVQSQVIRFRMLP